MKYLQGLEGLDVRWTQHEPRCIQYKAREIAFISQEINDVISNWYFQFDRGVKIKGIKDNEMLIASRITGLW